MNPRELLHAAVEDNVAWCAAVSAAHEMQEILTGAAWANLAEAPLYYPNVITRRPGAQAEVMALLDRLQGPRPWSVKDSFHDLDLHHLGFAPVIEAQWFGGIPKAEGPAAEKWDYVHTAEGLSRWVEAWGEDADASPFKPVLLADPRIRFWQLRRNGAIAAGAITFVSGPVIGLSNCFALPTGTAFSHGLMTAIATAFPGLPAVLWSDGQVMELEAGGLRPLGLLRVWIAD